MFIRLSLAATLLLLANLAVAADVTPPTDDAARANALSQQLGERLKVALQAAIKQGGPMAAITVCRDEAGPIAADVSRESGWTVGRTALRVRNPANAPDAWERQILEGFAMAAEDGANVAGLSFQETTGSGEAQRWRYMKAIPTGPMCTACHGSNIDPALEEAIRASYPEDQATGFAPGSLRGAFTMSHPTL
ncbi:MAG: DUF3365 domain-containing protein [Moraxellaceae bacterium]|jgi:hypothetical protein|nr:DUF3365 domain-containing protein [Moraxellaceae bacterium]MBP7230203.1 DUF3365 domain-containing protein [Moraxellaceae bacterium]MBP8851926.1 DUF3365 domain-containing protein [Moraxellaceae bacterium]MBP9045917.1 DUF3365 domain-containing protein [Moraxellaceae bacterium]MBP9731027.1 DUF3365 domain-containing protein [Moraxellaceae bacterium]